MTESSSKPMQGESLSNPPLFDGSNYSHWKNRMRIYMTSQDIELWKVVVLGPRIPTKEVHGQMVPKAFDEFDEADNKSFQINAMAMHMLYCALGSDEYFLVANCVSATEIWDRLDELYGGGTNSVDRTMITLLLNDYDSFVMRHPKESVSEELIRFIGIIKGLKSYGMRIRNRDLVLKLLQAIPKSWEPRVDVIQQGSNFDNLSLDEIMLSLMLSVRDD